MEKAYDEYFSSIYPRAPRNRFEHICGSQSNEPIIVTFTSDSNDGQDGGFYLRVTNKKRKNLRFIF